jgi:(p)ppGpp synthase/HD superfamily hydrolase
MTDIVQKALNVATAAHSGQLRKYDNEEYIIHPIAVAKLVADLTDDSEMIAAALLHDVVEDTEVTGQMIFDLFGARVAELVYDLTDQFTRENYPNFNRKKRKKLEAYRLGKTPKDVQLIKICDMADNTKSIIKDDPGFASLFLREKSYILEQMGYYSTKK